MKNKIETSMNNFVKNYHKSNNITTKWQELLFAYASAEDDMFQKLKSVVGTSHAMPKDFLENGKTIITYFIPFDESVNNSNIGGFECSEIWARAYIETNMLISNLNDFLCEELEKMGANSYAIPESYNFDSEKLVSDWSQRHVAFIAGLGTFGLNNMLITEKGCCGRIGSIITSLELEPTKRPENEYCLYKHNNSCKKCVNKCVKEALKEDGFNRNKCYEMCMINEKKYTYIGGCDICGKCIVGVPCSVINPSR
ncbi:TPA: epoxyqueuosine reductase [Clostridioides difficile]|uniref:epoxyqueuosine reductase n=1 Tax=Clostridioides difficile TaxID=1496 RepID=UPI001033C263|nr:epoxyqueuosine reductase [Clostridioides difficile]MDM0214440.1 epoxyqueuosine reductase [Clostridioides difficile]